MYIIAESAYNHQGSFEYVMELATEAKKSGADFFTVQIMNVDTFCTKSYEKYELYKNTEISQTEWLEVFAHCKKLELNLIPCTLEKESFDFAYNQGFRLVKIHGTDLTNRKLLEYINSKGDCRVLLETQCCTDFEINFAVNILKDNIECLIHGFSNYPTEIDQHNLLAVNYLKKEYDLTVGFADHSLDTQVIPCMAMSLGCKYLEKHITLQRSNRNFDYQVSLEPSEFAILVNSVNHYKNALGKEVKHPVEAEKSYRNILFKKHLGNEVFLRDNTGLTFFESEIDTFDKSNISVAIIARLKSQRLKKKVLKPFGGSELVISLYKRLAANCDKANVITLATSTLAEDDELYLKFADNNFPALKGHADSVIDRLLEVAISNKSAAVFRVTGDNPFTDPQLIDRMIQIFVENDVDYVRANDVPFGVSAELFSTKYLWNLYLRMDNPLVSEYLSWFVLKDESCRKASIELKSDKDYVKYVNLSVDYMEDYQYALSVLKKIGIDDFNEITLKDIVQNISNEHIVDISKEIKLPEGLSILYSDYMKMIADSEYVYKENIVL